MKYITIKIDTYENMITFIKNTYNNNLFIAYNEHLKRIKHIVYSTIDLTSVLESNMYDWLHDKLYEFGACNMLNNYLIYDLGFMNVPINIRIDL